MGYGIEPTWEVTSAGFSKCGLTPLQYEAIRYYTGSGYKEINAALRSDDPEKKNKVRAFAAVLGRALKRFKPYEGYVNRGTGELPANVVEQHKVGSVIDYKAFTSTSFGFGFGGKNRFKILSKSARLIDPFSTHPDEDEVLFPAGTKFLIKDLKIEPYTNTYFLEEVAN